MPEGHKGKRGPQQGMAESPQIYSGSTVQGSGHVLSMTDYPNIRKKKKGMVQHWTWTLVALPVDTSNSASNLSSTALQQEHTGGSRRACSAPEEVQPLDRSGPRHQRADTPGKEIVALATVSLVSLPVMSSSTEIWEPWLMVLGVLQNPLAYRLGPWVRAGFRAAPVRGPSAMIKKLSVDPLAKESYHQPTHTHTLATNSGRSVLDSLERRSLGEFLSNDPHLTHKGVQELQLRAVLTAVLSHCVTTLHDHVVRDFCSPHTDSPSTQTREDECVVPLSNGNCAAIWQWNVVKGAATGNQGPVVDPLGDNGKASTLALGLDRGKMV